MSALGHYLEEAGIASLSIALIRPQAEHTKGPRALWVPFELGRPIGPPSDAVFQRRVVLSALQMLEARDGGPVLLRDFPDDDPREAADLSWTPPIAPTPGIDTEGMAALADLMEAELRRLAPSYAQSCTERTRSTVGLSGLPPAVCSEYVAAWLRGERPDSPVSDMSPILCLRFTIDDLKAFVLEAALAGGAKPSSQQQGDWLWNETATGAAIRNIRRALLTGDDERARLIAGNFLVPGLRVTTGGLKRSG